MPILFSFRLSIQSMATRRFMGWLALGGDRKTGIPRLRNRAIETTDPNLTSQLKCLRCFVMLRDLVYVAVRRIILASYNV